MDGRYLAPLIDLRRPPRAGWGYRCVVALAATMVASSLCVAQTAVSTPATPIATAPYTPAVGNGGSYITPFPAGDVYKLQVYGADFVDGLTEGLVQALGTGEQVDVAKKPRVLKPLVRADYEDDIRAEEQARETVNIGVVMIGFDDRGSLRGGAKTLSFKTEAWKEQYRLRVDRLLKALKRRSIALYVVGLPPLRRPESNAEAETINEILLEKASANGIRFVEVAESFNDENGAYTQFGLDLSGTRAKLRDADGADFTQAGYRKLAALVAGDIKRDLVAAREDRSVPLAGGESEQRRINPDRAGLAPVVAAASATAKDGHPGPTGGSLAGTSAQPGASAPASRWVETPGGPVGQKADNSRIVLRFPSLTGREDLALPAEIVRPAVSAAVIGLLTRKETVEAGLQPFDLLVDDVGDGLSVATMVTAISDGSAANGHRRGPNALAAYTAVWVKGERLASKPGRADDFTWPRRDPYVSASNSTLPADTGDKRQPAALRKR